jgi:hypothetical protein
MEDYTRDFRYLAKHDDELMAQYPDEWVAIFDCKVVAHSPDRAEMWRQLEQLGLDRRFLVDAFLDTDPPTLVLLMTSS